MIVILFIAIFLSDVTLFQDARLVVLLRAPSEQKVLCFGIALFTLSRSVMNGLQFVITS